MDGLLQNNIDLLESNVFYVGITIWGMEEQRSLSKQQFNNIICVLTINKKTSHHVIKVLIIKISWEV